MPRLIQRFKHELEPWGQSALFDGVSSYILAPAYDFADGPWSISCWFRQVDASAEAGIWGLAGARVRLYNDGFPRRIRFELRNSSNNGGLLLFTPVGSLVSGQWAHSVLTWDGVDTARLYLDGIIRDTGSIPTNILRNTPFLIGREHFPKYTEGYLSNFALFNEAVDAHVERISRTRNLQRYARRNSLALARYYVAHNPISGVAEAGHILDYGEDGQPAEYFNLSTVAWQQEVPFYAYS